MRLVVYQMVMGNTLTRCSGFHYLPSLTPASRFYAELGCAMQHHGDEMLHSYPQL
jgi:hypothetical protein